MSQRWRGQAREYRQKQLLSLDKPKNHGRLHVPDIARGVTAEDKGDAQVLTLRLPSNLKYSTYQDCVSRNEHTVRDSSVLSAVAGQMHPVFCVA